MAELFSFDECSIPCFDCFFIPAGADTFILYRNPFEANQIYFYL